MEDKELRYYIQMAETKALRLNDEELYKLVHDLKRRIAKDRYYKRDNGVALEGKTDEDKVNDLLEQCKKGRLK